VPLTLHAVKGPFEQKPLRKAIIETFGATIISSPTESGREIRAQLGGAPGWFGITICEAAPNDGGRFTSL
jgi:tryptophan synthase beta chain